MRRQRSLSLSCATFLILLLCGQAAGSGSLHSHRRGRRTGVVRRLAEIVSPTAALSLGPEVAPLGMGLPRVSASDATNGTAAPGVDDDEGDEPPPPVSPPPMSPAPGPSTASPSPPPETEPPPPPPPAVAPSPEPAPVASPSPPPPSPPPGGSPPPPGESPAPAPAAPPPVANVEVTALMDFKSSITNGNSVPNMADWTADSSSPCAWSGITCDGTAGNVTAIDLTGSGLIGPLPDSITELLSLQSLLLGANFLTGNVPDSWNAGGALSALTALNLTGNRLYGLPTEFGSEGCSNLQTLDLSYNIMNGSLPGALILSKLSQASFVGNSLTGSLPAWVGPPSTATVAVLPQQSNGYLCGSVPSAPLFTFTDGTVRATLDNSLGSCFVTCSTITTQSLAGTNLFDVAVRSSVTAWDLAVHNDLAGGQGSATQVALPCYGTGSPVGAYFGGDAAYGQLAVTSSGETAPAGVTSHTTTSCYSGGDTVVIDLGASYALGAVVIRLGSGSAASEGSVRASASMSGANSKSCSGYVSSGTSRTAAADCTGSAGRYIWLTPATGSAAICGIQVYPLVSDSALAKSALYSQSSGSTGTVTSFTGSSTGISIGGGTPTFVLDLGYPATDVAAVVLTGGNGVESVTLSTSNPLASSSRRRRLMVLVGDAEDDDEATMTTRYNAVTKLHTNRRRLINNSTRTAVAESPSQGIVTTLAASGTACTQSGASTVWLCSGAGTGRYVVVTGSSPLSFTALRVYQQEAPDEDAPPAPPPPGGGSALVAQLLFIGGTVDTFELTNASDRKIFVDAINEGFGSAINASGYSLSPAYTTIESASSGVSPTQLGYTGTVPSGASTLLLSVSYTTTMPSSMANSVLGTAAVAQDISDGVSEGGFGSPTVWLASGELSPPPSPGVPSPPSGSKGLSTGALVGIIVGGSVGGLIVLFVIYWLCCRRRGRKKGAQKLNGPATGGKPAQGPWQHHASTDTMSGKMSEASEAAAALLAANGAAGALAPWTPPAGATGSLSTAGSAASSRNGAAQAIEWVTRSAAAAAGTPNSVGGRSAPATPTPGVDFKMWALNWSDLEIHKQIGEGSFGRVYLAKWNETFVAVKVLIQRGIDLSDPDEAGRVLSMSNPIMASLHKEAAMMASLRHPNVVGFLGLCTSPPCVASEYCARGSLTDVLRGAARSPAKAAQLDWQRRLNMALDACKGMLYLHSHGPPIIHRDLKSPNLLVDKHWRVKISDFNLSKLLDGESVQSSLAATNPRWLAPEILGRGSATFASDVYAFGMVLWELLTWELPWAGEGPWQVVALVNEGGRPPIPSREQLPGPDTQDWEGLDGFIDLIRRCWVQNPNDRPTFAEIIPCLRELLEALLTKNQAIGRPQQVVVAEIPPPTSEPTSSQPSATTSATPQPQADGVPGL